MAASTSSLVRALRLPSSWHRRRTRDRVIWRLRSTAPGRSRRRASARSLWSTTRVKACVCPAGVARVVAACILGRRLREPPLQVPMRAATRGASWMEERIPMTVEALASRELASSADSWPMCWWASRTLMPNLRPSARSSGRPPTWKSCASSMTRRWGRWRCAREAMARACSMTQIMPMKAAWSWPMRGAARSMRSTSPRSMTPWTSIASRPEPKTALMADERRTRSNLELTQASISANSLEWLPASSLSSSRARRGLVWWTAWATSVMRSLSASSSGTRLMVARSPNRALAAPMAWWKIRSKRGPIIPVCLGSKTA